MKPIRSLKSSQWNCGFLRQSIDDCRPEETKPQEDRSVSRYSKLRPLHSRERFASPRKGACCPPEAQREARWKEEEEKVECEWSFGISPLFLLKPLVCKFLVGWGVCEGGRESELQLKGEWKEGEFQKGKREKSTACSGNHK